MPKDKKVKLFYTEEDEALICVGKQPEKKNVLRKIYGRRNKILEIDERKNLLADCDILHMKRE